MLRNYLKISLRHLRRQKGYSFINISGLALGLACCVLILLFVQNELSYDRFHNKAERIYRVVMDAQSPNGSTDRFVTMSQRAGRAIREEFPEVQYVVRMSTWNPSIKHQGEYFYDDDFLFAEPAFFEIFSFPMLKGDFQTALNAPNALVMTASMERKYFAAASALGQTLTLNEWSPRRP